MEQRIPRMLKDPQRPNGEDRGWVGQAPSPFVSFFTRIVGMEGHVLFLVCIALCVAAVLCGRPILSNMWKEEELSLQDFEAFRFTHSNTNRATLIAITSGYFISFQKCPNFHSYLSVLN
uniref:Uncharacterized protein n=1 Tax=Kalanchoe fedtschenkoi TaxID=63787 RepID=A0A7N0T504_KALFE